jgi:hypothetical protein
VFTKEDGTPLKSDWLNRRCLSLRFAAALTCKDDTHLDVLDDGDRLIWSGGT